MEHSSDLFVELMILGVCMGTCISVCMFAFFDTTSDLRRKSEGHYISIPLSFQQFLHFYYMAPEKWNLYWTELSYDDENGDSKHIRLSFMDCIRYRRWLSKKLKRETSHRQFQETQQFLQSMRSEIDASQKTQEDAMSAAFHQMVARYMTERGISAADISALDPEKCQRRI